jgi:hypothetical protein
VLLENLKNLHKELVHTDVSLLGKVKVKLSLCLTKHHIMKSYWWSADRAPHILDLRTRWRWFVSFTPPLLYPQGKSPWYPLHGRLDGPQSQSGCDGGTQTPDHPAHSPVIYHWAILAPLVWTQWQKKFSASAGIGTPVTQPIAKHYTDWAAPAPAAYQVKTWILWSLT